MVQILEQWQFARCDRYTGVREGCHLRGMRPSGPGVETLWRKNLGARDIITRAGVPMTSSDSVPIVQWLDEDGTLLANDCEFQPDDGRAWGSRPAEGFLVRIDS